MLLSCKKQNGVLIRTTANHWILRRSREAGNSGPKLQHYLNKKKI